MQGLGHRLKERARALQLSNAEVARRAGLAERRYGHYLQDAREPDLDTLIRICGVLGLTPNELLQPDTIATPPRAALMASLASAALQLSDADLKVAILQVEALAQRPGKREQAG